MNEKKFLKFIEIWQKNFGIDKTIETKTAVDCQNRPLPWYTYPAIEYLQQFDYTDKKIFEYGCANSSLFWAARAQTVVSIEDNKAWFEKWQNEFKAENLVIKLRKEEAYVNAVFETKEKYDVIIIDGAWRRECASAAVQAVADDGLIIFDDSDRAEKNADFRSGLEALKKAGLLQVDFYGFCPTNIYPKCTSVFFSRNFNFKTKACIQPVGGIGSLWTLPRSERKKLYKLEQDIL